MLLYYVYSNDNRIIAFRQVFRLTIMIIPFCFYFFIFHFYDRPVIIVARALGDVANRSRSTSSGRRILDRWFLYFTPGL